MNCNVSGNSALLVVSFLIPSHLVLTMKMNSKDLKSGKSYKRNPKPVSVNGPIPCTHFVSGGKKNVWSVLKMKNSNADVLMLLSMNCNNKPDIVQLRKQTNTHIRCKIKWKRSIQSSCLVMYFKKERSKNSLSSANSTTRRKLIKSGKSLIKLRWRRLMRKLSRNWYLSMSVRWPTLR